MCAFCDFKGHHISVCRKEKEWKRQQDTKKGSIKKTEDGPETDAEDQAYSDTEIVLDLEATPAEEIATLNADLPDFLYLDTQM